MFSLTEHRVQFIVFRVECVCHLCTRHAYVTGHFYLSLVDSHTNFIGIGPNSLKIGTYESC